MTDRLTSLVAYLRAEADFNRSWADGRRGADRNFPEAYKARRLELAAEREQWAGEIGRLVAENQLLRDLAGGVTGADASDTVGSIKVHFANRRSMWLQDAFEAALAGRIK